MSDSGLLLDTHIVIWLATEPERVPLHYLKAIEESKLRFVSHVSALEVQIKNLKSPDTFSFSIDSMQQCMREFSLRELPMLLNDIKALSSMQFIHSDPFDRLLMAQAANQRLKFVTADSKILRTAEQYKEFSVLAD